MFIFSPLCLAYVSIKGMLLSLIAALALSIREIGILLLVIVLVAVGAIVYYYYSRAVASSPRSPNSGADPPSRRKFLIGAFAVSIVGSIAAMISPIIEAFSKGYVLAGDVSGGAGVEVKIANVSEVEPEKQVSFIMRRGPDGRPGMHPAILIRLPEDLASKAGKEFIAFSAVCTHLGCIVSYKGDKDEIFCPCHAGYFDPTDGKPVRGPPKKPLPEVKIRIDENGDIYAEGWS